MTHRPDPTTEVLLGLVECRSQPELVSRLLGATQRLLGAPAVGVYLFDDDRRPAVAACAGVPAGFLDEYELELRPIDPVLAFVCREKRAAPGAAVVGATRWPRSPVGAHLRRWGFAHNMQAPLLMAERVVGTLNVAGREGASPFAEPQLRRFDAVARTASATLARIRELERLQADCARLRAALDAAGSRAPMLDQLAPRAREVARLLCDGCPDKTIARLLGISVHTVKDHVRALRRRTGARTRTALARSLLPS